jgi:hypothetical protein
MNNQPVAWLSQGGDVSRSKDYFEEMGFKDLIPLYTHPAKTLTDEEILELADKHLIAETKNIGMGDCIAVTEGEIEFARAILRKAQEK